MWVVQRKTATTVFEKWRRIVMDFGYISYSSKARESRNRSPSKLITSLQSVRMEHVNDVGSLKKMHKFKRSELQEVMVSHQFLCVYVCEIYLALEFGDR